MLSFLKMLSTIRTFLKYAVEIYGLVRDMIIKGKQKKVIKQAKEAVEELKEANKIEDDNERLNKKAEAACKLEKSINPDSDC